MEKEFYSPTCVLTCKDVCGAPGKHRKDPKCQRVHQVILGVGVHGVKNTSQGACNKGHLPLEFLYCPLADQDAVIPFTTFKVN